MLRIKIYILSLPRRLMNRAVPVIFFHLDIASVGFANLLRPEPEAAAACPADSPNLLPAAPGCPITGAAKHKPTQNKNKLKTIKLGKLLIKPE